MLAEPHWGRGLMASFAAMVRAALPRIGFAPLYVARVVAQSPDLLTLGLIPDDPSVPPMDGVQLRHGLPGVTVKVRPGSTVLVGWSEADPAKPYCAIWEGGGQVEKLVLSADQVFVGGDVGAELTVKGETYRQAEADYNNEAAKQFNLAAGACVGPLAALKPMFLALALAAQQFELQAARFLSENARVR